MLANCARYVIINGATVSSKAQQQCKQWTVAMSANRIARIRRFRHMHARSTAPLPRHRASAEGQGMAKRAKAVAKRNKLSKDVTGGKRHQRRHDSARRRSLARQDPIRRTRSAPLPPTLHARMHSRARDDDFLVRSNRFDALDQLLCRLRCTHGCAVGRETTIAQCVSNRFDAHTISRSFAALPCERRGAKRAKATANETECQKTSQAITTSASSDRAIASAFRTDSTHSISSFAAYVACMDAQ